MEKPTFNWEWLIIETFAKTAGIQTEETSFNNFFDKHYIEIFKEFHIKNPTSGEVDLVKGLFLNASDDPLSLKNITFQMSKTISYDEIEELTFCCICPVITSTVKKHRELKPYLEQTGIVDIPIENVTENDLIGGKGDYFICQQVNTPYKIFKRNWLGKIVKMEWNDKEPLDMAAMDICRNDIQKMWIATGFGIVGMGIVYCYLNNFFSESPYEIEMR